MKIINEAEFHKITKEQPLVLVDFFATWCGPCKMLSPVLEEMAEEMKGEVEIVKVDVDAQPALAASYQIMSVPTMLLFISILVLIMVPVMLNFMGMQM